MKLKRFSTINENVNEEELPKIMFKVRIEEMDGGQRDAGGEYQEETMPKIVDQDESETKEGAMKIKREMMKQYELINHAGHVVNYSKRLELFTNF